MQPEISNRTPVNQEATRWKVAFVILMLGLLAFAGGFWIRGHRTLDDSSGVELPLNQLLAARELHAATAVTGDTFAMATGLIDDGVEGLYLLDFVTGDLQCYVLNWRTSRFAAVFRANVVQALGIDPAKSPKYLLTTGLVNFPRGATAGRPGNSVAYVMDTTTGNFAAYGLSWRRELAATGRPQANALILLDVGTARTAALRE